MTSMKLTATLALAFGGLVAAGACTYDRAPQRATASRWDAQDDDGRRVAEWEGQRTQEIASPFRGNARGESTGGPEVEGVATDVTTRTAPVAEARPGEPEADVDVDANVADEEPATTAQASEDISAEEDEAPLLEEASPSPRAVADPALAEIAQDDPPADPLIADGFLRDEACPMELEGTQVALVQRQEGPALVFRSRDRDDVEELQSRVLSLALTKDDERVEQTAEVTAEQGTRAALSADIEPQVQPPAQTDMLEGGQGDMPHNLPTELSDLEQEEAREPVVVSQGLSPLPEAEVTVELTDDGAEVLFEPRTRAERDDLTRQLTSRASALREGDCPADTMSMITPLGER